MKAIEYRPRQKPICTETIQRLLDINAAHRSSDLSRGATKSVASQAAAFILRRAAK